MEEDFIPTRARIAKSNQSDFLSVEYTTHKKVSSDNSKSKPNSTDNEKLSPEEIKRGQELEMKRFRWDVMKFGASGFVKAKKNKAKAGLVLQLGGKPLKSRKNENYKELKARKSRDKARAEMRKTRESGLAHSLIKVKANKTQKPKRKDSILEVYGKVDRKKKSGKL